MFNTVRICGNLAEKEYEYDECGQLESIIREFARSQGMGNFIVTNQEGKELKQADLKTMRPEELQTLRLARIMRGAADAPFNERQGDGSLVFLPSGAPSDNEEENMESVSDTHALFDFIHDDLLHKIQEEFPTVENSFLKQLVNNITENSSGMSVQLKNLAAEKLSAEIIKQVAENSIRIERVVIENKVDFERFRIKLAETLTAYTSAITRLYMKSVRDIPTGNGIATDLISPLLCRMYANGFKLENCRPDKLIFKRNVEMEIKYFQKDGYYYCLSVSESPYYVTDIQLDVNISGNMNSWVCRVNTPNGHPNVSHDSGELCAGDIKGKSLLEADAIALLLKIIEVPNLDSAFFTPENLIPTNYNIGWS
jgi:hypothetical protein